MFWSNCSKDLWTFTAFQCHLTSNSLSHLHRFHEISYSSFPIQNCGSPVPPVSSCCFAEVVSMEGVECRCLTPSVWGEIAFLDDWDMGQKQDRLDISLFGEWHEHSSLNIVYIYCIPMYSCCFFMSNLASILIHIQKTFAFWIDSLRVQKIAGRFLCLQILHLQRVSMQGGHQMVWEVCSPWSVTPPRLGGGNSFFLDKNHPDPWGDDPIWQAFFFVFQLGWNHQLEEVSPTSAKKCLILSTFLLKAVAFHGRAVKITLFYIQKLAEFVPSTLYHNFLSDAYSLRGGQEQGGTAQEPHSPCERDWSEIGDIKTCAFFHGNPSGAPPKATLPKK